MKFLLRILVLLSVVITPSCLEMVEEISLEKNGSGNYSMAVDMSQMMEMLSGLMGDTDDPTTDAFAQMDSAIQETVKKLRQIEGISNVSHQSEGYRFSVNYSFSSVEALNQANLNEDNESAAMLGMSGSNYSLAKRVFSRQSVPISDMLGEMDDEEGMMDMVKMFMADASYKQIYHMPGQVKSAANDNSEISSDKRTVTTEIPLLDWMNGDADIGNAIKFKKR